jgi:hypothetical protein
MMASLKTSVVPGLLDLDRVSEIFAVGVASIETFGGCARIVLFVSRTDGVGEIERHVVARGVVPTAILPIVQAQAAAMAAGLPFVSAVPTDDDGPLVN